ncbi:hypothetical protein C0992_005692 [Termitomyces sp. T32_za158]|nr:hypothetical protein C0992_005692 [Termitomyces sp. T32_za158]
MAGTFTAVGLIFFGVVVALVFFSKKSRPRDIESYESFMQFPTSQLSSGSVTPFDDGRLPASPGISAHDLETRDPINPKPSSQVYSEYSSCVPQGLAPDQERGSDAKIPPSNTVYKRPNVKRDSYQSSIDSFYGASGT